ncbi:bifunctional 3-(3-hydroxy-phenyl)propionate/3-hydroxycinnamic acid hydroxylase [Pusillimonas noertemannii]|uniref:bifunctional 3-(3-hydroxy-phenyl)propionate/3-hydroxycinnamic acid hydroxylase n=1 Tax=Pusillimonas noertemannii TaxID=305977 RepID=UPI0002EB8821|nr:bifunctional 3-(3-hydroxy-phenyl)propionate/3-hydroxycinnamic acid hydroxylase [Pusillimonas noertemannii]
MNPDHRIPVAIVGAGPIGLTLANLLSTYGVPVVLLEKNSTTVQQPRAISIDDESLRTLQVAGLADEMLKLCALDYGSVYLDTRRRPFAKVSPSTAEFGYPRRTAFSQPQLEALLREGLDRFGTVDARFGHEVTHLQQNESGAVLQVRAANGAQYTLHAHYVAACDGGRSPLRHMLDIGMSGHTYEKKWLIIDLEGTRDNFRETRVYCDPRRPGINLPGPGRTRRFEFMLLDGETDEQVTDEAFVRRLLRDHGPDENARIVRKQVYTFHALMARQWRKGRAFLLGDAAHLTPPFAGQGLNSGLRDAANLAWKLAGVVQGRLHAKALDSYQQERPEHAWQLIEMAITLGRIMMPDTMSKAHLIQSGFRALRLVPPLNDYITQMRYKPKPRFSKGFFVADGAAPRDTLVGRMLTQPLVETQDRQTRKLDEVLANGFALLAFADDPQKAFDGLPAMQFEERLGINRVCITSRFYNPFEGPQGIVAVRDQTGAFEERYPGARDYWLLVRPDRYVMARIPRQAANTTVDALRQLLSSPAAPRSEPAPGTTLEVATYKETP